MKKRIGIYAGTFDPVHKGHLALAKLAAAKAELDEVVLLVEPKPRGKSGVTPIEHRLKMARLATKRNDKLNVLSIEGEQFSVAETLPMLQKRFQGAELVMIMGSDVFAGLPRWPDVEKLTSTVKFIVSIRHGQDETAIDDASIETGAEFMLVENNWPKTSASQIRRDFESNSDFVDPAVADYIRQNNLYKA